MKRKVLLRSENKITDEASPDIAPVVSKRAAKRERLQKLAERNEKAKREIKLIDFFSNILRPHWGAFLFWPLAGFAWGWGMKYQYHCAECYFPWLGAFVGGGVAFCFYLEERKYSNIMLALYGLLAGYFFAVLTDDSKNVVVYSVVGLALGFFGRYFVGLLLRFSQAL